MEIMFAREGLPGVTEQPTLVKREGDTITPLVIFQKAEDATETEYNAVINFLIMRLEKQ